ncbi:S1 family peptidase [Archangium primigenium]|uniref:S1 family peptidase n=1 Tax=[Archangium] primigenium TaxID=2792470 RepID=UPI00195DD94E|nr:serine protease [Archangium primigenium]MBM7114008.1 trypsin-like peptidase domain-containing protein [Archangium primigenium]
MTRTRWGGLLALGLLAACTPTRDEAPAASAPTPEAVRVDGFSALKDATVTLYPGHCAGVIVADGHHALTAAHCIRGEPGSRQPVVLRKGQLLGGEVKVVDVHRDVAVIRLDTLAPVHPLAVASTPPTPGMALLFAGRNDRPGEPQEIELRRLGRCPSLPDVPQALFTSLRGAKGDSGAPVVDEHLRVVGLVHGGAACSIAAPTVEVSPLVDMLVAEVARPDAQQGVGGSGSAP